MLWLDDPISNEVQVLIEAVPVVTAFVTAFLCVDSLMANNTVEPSWENNLSFLFMRPFIFTKRRNLIFVRLLSAYVMWLKSVREDGRDKRNNHICLIHLETRLKMR